MVVILMGVSGAGKTTIGLRLAERLSWAFHDADDLHTPENVRKMERGQALDDEDRQPWLEALQRLIDGLLDAGESAVIACSALKQQYRDLLVRDEDEVRLVYLKGSYELIEQRMAARKGHFFEAGLLATQFAALEEPDGALVVDIALAPDEVVETIVEGLSITQTR